jgi:hypothetical protein
MRMIGGWGYFSVAMMATLALANPKSVLFENSFRRVLTN